jgi:hypothetical protein
LAQTWSNGAVTFTGVKLNVTNTNSAAASLLMDLQVGGTSLFSVGKAGNAKASTGSAATPSYAMDTTGMYSRATFARVNFSVAGTDTGVEIGAATLALQNTTSLFWTAGLLPSSSPDTYITRSTKNTGANIQLGAADAASPVAQTLSVQSIVGGLSGTPNLSAAAYPFTITGAQGTGTGAGGSIIFQVAPAGGSGTAQNALVAVASISSNGFLNFPNLVGGYNGFRFQIAGVDRATCAHSNGDVIFSAFNASGAYLYDTLRLYNATGAVVCQSGLLQFSTGTSPIPDISLARDAANTLAQKNSTNAQEFRVYETTTGSIYKALLGNRQLMKISGASFTDGAGASAGTMTNAPTAGNPTKWIPIDDNGTTRYIPAW